MMMQFRTRTGPYTSNLHSEENTEKKILFIINHIFLQLNKNNQSSSKIQKRKEYMDKAILDYEKS